LSIYLHHRLGPVAEEVEGLLEIAEREGVGDEGSDVESARFDEAQRLLEAAGRIGEDAVDPQILQAKDIGLERHRPAAPNDAQDDHRAAAPRRVDGDRERLLAA
jgi:hypothetical protein